MMTTGRTGNGKNPLASCAFERAAKIWDAVRRLHLGYEQHITLNRKAVHKSEPALTHPTPKYHLQTGCRPHKTLSRKEGHHDPAPKA